MESSRKDRGGPVAIAVAVRAVMAGIRWQTRKPPGAEAPGAGNATRGETPGEAGVAVRISPGACKTQRLPGITPASADCREERVRDTSRALATKSG